MAKTVFGERAKNELFDLDMTVSFTNHGSYGTVPRPIRLKRQELQYEVEKAPDVYYRYTYPNLWNENRAALAKYLKINQDHLVLTENATDSVNSVLKTVEFNGAKDTILVHEYTYNAVLNAVKFVSQYRLSNDNHINIVKIPDVYPIKSKQEILDQFDDICRDTIENKKLRLRLVLLDHISSATATLFPINDMIQIVRKWEKAIESKIYVLVDAAHAIGQISIDLNELDCDYYTSNLHKWFFAPRGCAFLYFKDAKDSLKLIPNIISHNYGQDAVKNYFERGTRDNTSWFLIKDCIKIYEEHFGGIEAITSYCSGILSEAVDILTKGWNTTLLQIPKECEAPFMRNIKLPVMKNYDYSKKSLVELSLDINKDLYLKFKVISCIVPIENTLYCRISCFVHNKIDDYIKLKDAVLELNK